MRIKAGTFYEDNRTRDIVWEMEPGGIVTLLYEVDGDEFVLGVIQPDDLLAVAGGIEVALLHNEKIYNLKT